MSKVSVRIPSMLANLFGGDKEFKATAENLGELIQHLIDKHGSEVSKRMLDSNGKLKQVINIYVNGKNVRFTGELETKLQDDDVISVLPAVAGG